MTDEDIKNHRYSCGGDLEVIEALEVLREYCEKHGNGVNCEKSCVLKPLCEWLEDVLPSEFCDLVLKNNSTLECRNLVDGMCHWGITKIPCEYDTLRKRICTCAGYVPINQ